MDNIFLSNSRIFVSIINNVILKYSLKNTIKYSKIKETFSRTKKPLIFMEYISNLYSNDGYIEFPIVINMKDIIQYNNILQLGNGGDYIRKSSSLVKYIKICTVKNKNNITNFLFDCSQKEQEYTSLILEDKKYNTNGIHTLILFGKNSNKVNFSQNIPNNVRDYFKNSECYLCSKSSDIEIDHRNGRKTTTCFSINDFQPLCKQCNDVKRQRCKECKKTCGIKVPLIAKRFGYKTQYDNSCEGCYWYGDNNIIDW